MATRKKPNWAVLDGGPLDGQQHLLHPNAGQDALVLIYVEQAAVGMRTPHEYRATNTYRTGAMKGRIAGFVRTLPTEPIPSPAPVPPASVWQSPTWNKSGKPAA